VFSSVYGLRVMIDLAGLAIAGGLYIVPTFAAVQAWAGADRRARVIAGVNVLNAAFMVAGTVVVAALQAFHVTTPTLFVMIGVATLIVAITIGRTMPANPMMDFLSIVFRALYRVEVKGVENLLNAGPNPIIALNHVSFLDAALAMSLLPKDPVFAIDSEMAKKWWVRPFLHFTRAMPLDPTKPMATQRDLFDAASPDHGDNFRIDEGGKLVLDLVVRHQGIHVRPMTGRRVAIDFRDAVGQVGKKTAETVAVQPAGVVEAEDTIVDENARALEPAAHQGRQRPHR